MFTLVVDDFVVKCKSIRQANHLKEVLEKYHEVSVNWKGKLFCGFTLDWRYDGSMGRHVNQSMPSYINKSKTKYQHPFSTQLQHAPYKTSLIEYGKKVQHVTEPENSASHTAKQINHVQDVLGTLLYYICAVDPTITTSLSSISSRQSKGTQAVIQSCNQLLDYVVTYPNAAIRYHARNMILMINTDASYLF